MLVGARCDSGEGDRESRSKFVPGRCDAGGKTVSGRYGGGRREVCLFSVASCVKMPTR
jgi:hypothetical protein